MLLVVGEKGGTYTRFLFLHGLVLVPFHFVTMFCTANYTSAYANNLRTRLVLVSNPSLQEGPVNTLTHWLPLNCHAHVPSTNTAKFSFIIVYH